MRSIIKPTLSRTKWCREITLREWNDLGVSYFRWLCYIFYIYCYSSTTCITVACNPGYELTINGTCEKCPIGYYSAGISGAACKLCPTLIPENCKFSEDGVTSPVVSFPFFFVVVIGNLKKLLIVPFYMFRLWIMRSIWNRCQPNSEHGLYGNLGILFITRGCYHYKCIHIGSIIKFLDSKILRETSSCKTFLRLENKFII